MLHAVFFESEGALHCESVSLEAIARTVPPPFYVYSARALVERVRAADRAFSSHPHVVCFAVKANSHPTLLRLAAAQGAGAEVVSGAEMMLALEVGFPPERVVFSGVGKNRAELEAGIEAGILIINAESEGEVELLETLAARTSIRPSVGIRVNPGIDAHTHPHMATGVEKAKFGVGLQKAREIFARRKDFPHVVLAGIHSHIGSQITAIEPLAENARELAGLVGELKASGVHITDVDIGGGLGISYRDEAAPDFAAYAQAVLPQLAATGARILMELGRSLFAPAGALVVDVLYVKEVHGRRYVVVNSGMNDFLRPALYGAYHHIVPVSSRAGRAEPFDVVGAVCESSDSFGADRLFVPPAPGDLLAILDAGAYGYSMSSNYNLRPRPAEVLVEGERFRVIRAAETMKGLVAHELGSAL